MRREEMEYALRYLRYCAVEDQPRPRLRNGTLARRLEVEGEVERLIESVREHERERVMGELLEFVGVEVME
jgi:hypothetical protein